jgi:hypothetical protein
MSGWAGYVGADADRGRALLHRMAAALPPPAVAAPAVGVTFGLAGQVVTGGGCIVGYAGELTDDAAIADVGGWTGAFAVARAELDTGAILLARDAHGPTVYLARASGIVVFGTSISALLASDLIVPQADDQAVFRYLHDGTVDDTGRTFFTGVEQIGPGQLVRIPPDGTITKDRLDGAPARGVGRLGLVRTGRNGSAVVASGGARPTRVFAATVAGADDSGVDAAIDPADEVAVRRLYVEPSGLRTDVLDFVRAQQEPVADLGAYLQYCALRLAAEQVERVDWPAVGTVPSRPPAGPDGCDGISPLLHPDFVTEQANAEPDRGPTAALAPDDGSAAAVRTTWRNAEHFGVAMTASGAGANGAAADAASIPPEWVRALRPDVWTLLESPRFGARPYFDQPSVLRAVHAARSGKGGVEANALWRIVTLELWLRAFVDGPETEPAPLAPTGPDGRHAQAPAKSDYTPNAHKQLLLRNGRWARFPLRVDLVAPGDDVAALAGRRAGEFFAGLPDAPKPAADLAADGRWYLFVGEKIVAIAQGRFRFVWDIHPGWWARRLSQAVGATPFGIGVSQPETMQVAIDELGLPRILLAAGAGAVGKLLRRPGWFYRVTGSAARAIDGPADYCAYPANVSAKLAPADPDRVARAVSAAVHASVPEPVGARYGGCVIIDANDLGRNVLGHDTQLDPATLAGAFADNPLGQSREQTPIAVVISQ